MEQFDAAIIGFGTAGRALGATLADAGKSVAIVEQSDKMYGGACVNNACIPTKVLVESARLSAAMGGPIDQKEERFLAAIDRMNNLRVASRERSYRTLADRTNITIIDGRAAFTDRSHMAIATPTGTRNIEAKRLFIDTGSLPLLPAVPGIDSPRVYTSASLIDIRTMPHQLIVVGGGFVGLEFASIYADFGVNVTIIENEPAILSGEDPETAHAIRTSLQNRGITILCNTALERIDDQHDQVIAVVNQGDKEKHLPAHAVLMATGRKPNTAGLNLSAAGIKTNKHGIVVDKHLRTTAADIWAMGDVTGGLQFTYIAYDDYRIVASDVLGNGARTTENRGAIPRCTFIRPPFARIGMTADEARAAGHKIRIASLAASDIAQSHILQNDTGLIKTVVDAECNLILGMDLFCEDSQELVNIIKLVMDAHIPATALRNAVFSHPSMTEAFNNLFSYFKT